MFHYRSRPHWYFQLTGAAFVVLTMVGNGGATAGSAQAARPAGEQVLRDATHQVSSASVTVGVVLEVARLRRGFSSFWAISPTSCAVLPGVGVAASPRVPVSSRAR